MPENDTTKPSGAPGRVESDDGGEQDSDYEDYDHDNNNNSQEGRIHTANTPAYGGRSKLQQKFYKMSSALCEVVDDYGLVSFHPMNIEDVEVGVLYCTCCTVLYCMYVCLYMVLLFQYYVRVACAILSGCVLYQKVLKALTCSSSFFFLC